VKGDLALNELFSALLGPENARALRKGGILLFRKEIIYKLSKA
jgi:hypothetical protein